MLERRSEPDGATVLPGAYWLRLENQRSEHVWVETTTR